MQPGRRGVDGFIVISLKQSMEQDAEHLLQATLGSYRATIEAVGEAALQADPATGEALHQTMGQLSSGLDQTVSAARIAETQQIIDQELKTWSRRASDTIREKTSGMQDVLLIAGAAAEQVGERARHHAKRFTEFGGRLAATSKLSDLTTIRHSLGQHTTDLRSYVAQMVKENESTISQLRAQIASYEARL